MRFGIFVLFLIFPFGFLIAKDHSEYCSMDRLCVIYVQDKTGVDIYFQNKIAIKETATTLSVNAISKNMKSSVKLPLVTVIQGSKRKKLFRLTVNKPNKRWVYQIKFKWILGNFSVHHNPKVVYDLPFEKGMKVRVYQGYKGTKSHQGDNRYSIDFGLKEGDLITAARDGVVIDTEQKNNEGGFEIKYIHSANYVKILHDDGTIGQYAHLRYMGVLVKRGQRVSSGSPLGYAGSTGFSDGPHLHFEVYKPTPHLRKKTIPTKFHTESSDSEILAEGQLHWKRDPNEPMVKTVSDIEEIQICESVQSLEKLGCHSTTFSKSSPLYFYIPLLKPSRYKIQISVRKNGTTISKLYNWETNPEWWDTFLDVQLEDPSESLEGDWTAVISIDGVIQKEIQFQITSVM
ncbi:M23 family metallopeptidase [Leptospira meyeri]|uniref:M23 family metallopeptidase n=1 Tax=Leptospira meyeri TaxID=29508 RepID=UPI000C2B20ED|nr:M23 family metallopeptidase [Leptospira meyeri]PKA24263.1 peptidase [Leptospira sp. mixed culture ATI2-C-A1]PJZ80249.1 peptidase [Leptospira meyeri]PJZ95441.1 peptidase [Leptospira meyeri]PKA10782.1 peptidase [Leptospira meyeri]TGM24116.1 M23 family metallopeptidase [Leptospira meyeri]